MDSTIVKIEFSVEEVNSILAVLGELPTKTGVWPLCVKIKEQAESQVKNQNKFTE